MNKIITLLCFCICLQITYTQNNDPDTAKASLTNYKDPAERFTATIKYLETLDSYASNYIDSSLCVELLLIAQQLKNDSLLAISYDWIGYYFAMSKGANTTALEYYFKALPLAEKYNDKRRISSVYFDIASVYFNLKNIEEYFNITQKGGNHLPDKSSDKYDYMLIQYQRNIGVSYYEKNQLDSALFYAQVAEQTAERLKLPLYRAQTLTLLAVIYYKMNELELAEIYFNKAKNLSETLAVRKDVFYKRYIPFLIEQNRMDEAIASTEYFWNITREMQNLNIELIAAGFKRQLFDKLNNSDSAFYYSKVESQIRESIFNQNNQNTIQALAFKEQLRIIEEDAKKLEVEQQRKQNIQYALIAIGIVFFIILFFLLSHSIIITEKWISFFGILGLLIVFEFINLLIHPFLERITHHSPALMLIALVVLASLLIPMHHRMEKWIKEKMTEKNKKIRLENAKKTIEKLESQM
jgi:tetratricopeptide (TPR) repeat protein